MNKKIIFLRIFAWIVDWNVTLFPFFGAVMLSTFLLKNDSPIFLPIVFFDLLLIVSAFVVFVLRDFIFKGRSLGKRLFDLYIYDKNTLQQTSTKQRCLRNIFFFIYFIDGIILLATGETIGDRVAKTVVLTKQARGLYT